MHLFDCRARSLPEDPTEITDGNGHTWKRAVVPGPNGEPAYCSRTSPDVRALPLSEIEARYGIRRPA